jgi:hypothetical protein
MAQTQRETRCRAGLFYLVPSNWVAKNGSNGLVRATT